MLRRAQLLPHNATLALHDAHVPSWLQGTRLWTLAAWVVVVPTAWMRSLRQISWLSGAGVALLFGLTGILVYAAAKELTSAEHEQADGSAASAHDGVTWRERYDELPHGDHAFDAAPCAFAMVLFSFSCHAMVPGYEQGMRPSQRHLWDAVVVVTFAGCAVFKAAFMAAGWLAFGAPSLSLVPTLSRP